MTKQLKQSILTSYLIGIPAGFLTIAITLLAPSMLTGEGILTMGILGAYGIPTIGLAITFLAALWIGGKLAFTDIKERKSLILISFRYSVMVNAIIWTVFCAITAWQTGELVLIIPPLIAFIACTILTTFSIGLLIVYIIKRINHKQDTIKKYNYR